MAGDDVPPDEVRDALAEMQLYFSDRVAPLLVGDSLALLMSLPARVLAQEIQAWVAGQYRAGATEVATAEFLFHALRKVHAVGEFQLVPAGELNDYLQNLAASVMELCPPADREILRVNLSRLGEPVAGSAATLTHIHRFDQPAEPRTAVATRQAEPAPAASDTNLAREVATSLRRFSLLLDRYQGDGQGVAPGAPSPQGGVVSQLVSSAAAISSTQKDLDAHLERLRQLGMAGGTDEMFKVLGESLPGWTLPRSESGFIAPTASAQADAMEKIVALSREDPAESAKRFRQMVDVAIDQFNAGSLAKAVTILDVADRIAGQKLVHSSVIDRVRSTAHGKLDIDRLRKVAESPEKRPQLSRVLSFFTAFTPEGLLDSLRSEPKRDRRRLDLALLEAQGAPARNAALARLETSLKNTGEPEDAHFQRNLLYVLRLIPHSSETPWDGEIEVLRQLARSSSPAFLVKEVVNNLGHAVEVKASEKAERVLVFLLRGFERMLEKRERIYTSEDLLMLLDRTCLMLARYGGPSAWAEVVDHGLSTSGELGNTGARIAELGCQDLSRAPEVLARLTDVVTSELPKRGFNLAAKNEAFVVSLIQALGGTTHARVRDLLKDIVVKYPNRPIALEATRVLGAVEAATRPTPSGGTSLSGDLELFGLSTLLQNVADLKMTGVLTLLDLEGRPSATLLFDGGLLTSCQTGKLAGREAFYQLFERPFPGTFGFVRRPGPEPRTSEALEVLPLVLEAIHRYDELQRSVALVSDDAAFEPTGIAPTRPPDEQDEALVSVLWDRATRGLSAMHCEAEIPVDAYRVRHLLEHWFQEGALRRT
jgi:hypothetical protein